MPFLPKNGSASSKVNAALSINRASRRLVKRAMHSNPFPSSGIRSNSPPDDRPETNPCSYYNIRLKVLEQSLASRKLFGSTVNPLTLPAKPTFLSPALFIKES